MADGHSNWQAYLTALALSLRRSLGAHQFRIHRREYADYRQYRCLAQEDDMEYDHGRLEVLSKADCIVKRQTRILQEICRTKFVLSLPSSETSVPCACCASTVIYMGVRSFSYGAS
jgi:hypothetical protein